MKKVLLASFFQLLIPMHCFGMVVYDFPLVWISEYFIKIMESYCHEGLINQRIPVNVAVKKYRRNMPPLMALVLLQKGDQHLDWVHKFLENGADICFEYELIKERAAATRKTSALHLATGKCNDLIYILCEHLKKHNTLHLLNYQDRKGNTALHSAARKNDSEAIQVLLSYGAQANVLNNLSQTPLHALVFHTIFSETIMPSLGLLCDAGMAIESSANIRRNRELSNILDYFYEMWLGTSKYFPHIRAGKDFIEYFLAEQTQRRELVEKFSRDKESLLSVIPQDLSRELKRFIMNRPGAEK